MPHLSSGVTSPTRRIDEKRRFRRDFPGRHRRIPHPSAVFSSVDLEREEHGRSAAEHHRARL
jgi:hypothetical protein